MYSYQQISNANGVLEQEETRTDVLAIDADLAMALRISEEEQQRIEDELKQEEQLIAEVLRLSLQEK